MRFRKVESSAPVPAFPFPVRLYLVGVGCDGSEVVRQDLHVTLTSFDEEAHFESTVFKLDIF